jgi:hypothetical protein
MSALLCVMPSARRYWEKKVWRRSSCGDPPESGLRRCRAMRAPRVLPAWSDDAMVLALTLAHIPAPAPCTHTRQPSSANYARACRVISRKTDRLIL